MQGSKRGKKLVLVLAVSATASLAASQPAGAVVTGTNSASTVATAIGTSSGSGFTFTVGPLQAGTGNSPLSGFPTAGATYGVLTSGNSELADNANTGNGDGANLGIEDPGRGDANDSQTLRMDVTVPGGSNCLNLDYKFFSEEFPEFVNAGFNDGFVAEMDSSTWATTDQKISAPLDFAAGYGDQVAVDTVGPTIVDPSNSTGTTYDAATKTITTKTVVTPGPHSLYLSVFDAGDHIFDSAVFVDNLRYTNEDPKACKPPDIFEGKLGAGLKGKPSVKGKNLLVPITCLLPAGANDPCVGTVSVSASANGTSAAAAKNVTVAKGSYSVQPGQTAKAKAKLTKAGKRLAKAKGKLKAKVKITNTINDVAQTFKVKF